MRINWLMWADFLSVLLVMVIFRVFLKFCRLPTEQVALEIFLRCGEYLPEKTYGIVWFLCCLSVHSAGQIQEVRFLSLFCCDEGCHVPVRYISLGVVDFLGRYRQGRYEIRLDEY